MYGWCTVSDLILVRLVFTGGQRQSCYSKCSKEQPFCILFHLIHSLIFLYNELVSVSRCNSDDTLVITTDGYALKYNTNEIPNLGLKTSGVKSIKLSSNANVIGAFVVSELKEYLCVFTDKNTAKRIYVDTIEKTSRAKKGTLIIKSPKSKKYTIIKAFNIGSKNIFGIIDKEIGYLKASDINILDKSSTGNTFTKKNVDDIFVVAKYTDIVSQSKANINEPMVNGAQELMDNKEEVIEQPKERKLTMSDFFDEFKL